MSRRTFKVFKTDPWKWEHLGDMARDMQALANRLSLIDIDEDLEYPPVSKQQKIANMERFIRWANNVVKQHKGV